MSASAPVLRSLKGDRDFQRLRRGRSGGARLLSLRWRPTPRAQVRVGIVTSRKVGNAVVRNRVRRRLREGLKELLGLDFDPRALHAGVPSFDLIVIVRPEAATADFQALRGALERAFTKAGLTRGPERR